MRVQGMGFGVVGNGLGGYGIRGRSAQCRKNG